MPYLVVVKTDNLRRLLASWHKPSPTHRKLREGQIIKKLAGRIYLFDDAEDTLYLLMELLGRHPKEVDTYYVEERTHKQIVKDLSRFSE